MFIRRVLVELVPICQHPIHGSSHRLAPLIRVATELLYGDLLDVSETSLVTAGILARSVNVCLHPLHSLVCS
jgi:hypothetical protein